MTFVAVRVDREFEVNRVIAFASEHLGLNRVSLELLR